MKTGFGKVRPGDRLFRKEMQQNPYAVYDSLREQDPVHWDDVLKAWAVTRYDDVAMVLNDRRFSSKRLARVRQRFPQKELEPLFDTLAVRMSERDEPDHKRLRALVHDAFLRTSVEEWTPRIQERIDGLLDEAAAEGEFDLISKVAIPLPLGVVLELVGIPSEDRFRVRTWCDDFAVVALNAFADVSTEQLQRGVSSILEFREYLKGRIGELERSSGKELLSSLVQAQHDGAGLSLEELLANTLLLLAAGNETTTCLIGNGVAALLRFPDQMDLLRSDRSLLPNAVEECLRYDSPVQFLGRVADEDVTIRGQSIRRGDMVLAFLGAANRDPEQFEDPDRFDITRPHMHQLAFGHGPHFCVGSQLARLEARVTLGSLLDRFSKLEWDPTRALTYRENFNLRCLEELVIRVSES